MNNSKTQHGDQQNLDKLCSQGGGLVEEEEADYERGELGGIRGGVLWIWTLGGV